MFVWLIFINKSRGILLRIRFCIYVNFGKYIFVSFKIFVTFGMCYGIDYCLDC